MDFPTRGMYTEVCFKAGVAQWQSTAFVKLGLRVRIPPPAPTFGSQPDGRQARVLVGSRGVLVEFAFCLCLLLCG